MIEIIPPSDEYREKLMATRRNPRGRKLITADEVELAKRIESSIAIIDKRRSGPNQATAMHLIGDVRDKTAIILDDMIDPQRMLVDDLEHTLVFLDEFIALVQ